MLILDGLQAVPERWTDEEVLGCRGVLTTMLHSHVLDARHDGVRSLPEPGWASINAVSMPTHGFRGAIQSFAAMLADLHAKNISATAGASTNKATCCGRRSAILLSDKAAESPCAIGSTQ